MDSRMELTLISEQEYERIGAGDMSPEMAAQYLQEGSFRLRSFSEVLRSFYPEGDLQPRLITSFLDDNGDANPETVSRTVRNWLSDRSKPTKREDVFHIAFALGFSEEQANRLLGLCTDYGIHYRDGRDVVYAWFLRHGGSYCEARRFFDSLPPMLDVETDACKHMHLTHDLQNAFLQIHSEEELRSCYLANLERFGALHLRAYTYFCRYLDKLLHPVPAWTGMEEEANYSVEAVMDLYFSMHMPSSRSRAGYTVVQRLIKQNWPNATALKNIRSHKADVPRKLLLLLYVITENAVDSEYRETDEDYMSARDRLDDHWWAINAILTDCGMPPLDPRNATDWLVLYAVTAAEESMSERMEQVIELLFSGDS